MMPISNTPSALVADPNTLPIEYLNVAPADVAIAVIATYYDAATLGTLPPGEYRISANVSILNLAVAAAFANTKIMVGAVPYAPTESSVIISGTVELSTPAFNVYLPVAAIIKIQATMSQIGTIKAAGVNGGALPGATWIKALRVR